MISCNTVLVLGAGASMPYGFPSGVGLIQEICTSVEDRSTPYHLVRIALNGLLPQEVTFGDPEEHIQNFTTRLRDSELYSVDRFLAENKKYSTVGRMFIAAIIRSCESADMFNADSIRKRKRGGHWLRLFLNKLRNSLNRSHRRFADNKLSVVTFNYDRSLEEYINSTVPNWYAEDTNPEEIRRISSSVDVFHVYGDVDVKRAYHRSPPEIGFADDPPTSAEIYVLRNVFTTIHDWTSEPEETDSIQRAKRALSDADQILFLGFGFDSMNLNILGIDDDFLSDCSRKRCLSGKRFLAGTCLGMGWAEKADVSRSLNEKLTPVTADKWSHKKNHLYELDCYNFFRFADVIR